MKFFLSVNAFSSNSSLNDSDYTYTLFQDISCSEDIEIEGIVVNTEQIKIVSQYVNLFYQQRNLTENLRNHSITITEKNLPKLRSQIFVQIENQLLFPQVFQLSYEKTRDG